MSTSAQLSIACKRAVVNSKSPWWVSEYSNWQLNCRFWNRFTPVLSVPSQTFSIDQLEQSVILSVGNSRLVSNDSTDLPRGCVRPNGQRSRLNGPVVLIRNDDTQHRRTFRKRWRHPLLEEKLVISNSTCERSVDLPPSTQRFLRDRAGKSSSARARRCTARSSNTRLLHWVATAESVPTCTRLRFRHR